MPVSKFVLTDAKQLALQNAMVSKIHEVATHGAHNDTTDNALKRVHLMSVAQSDLSPHAWIDSAVAIIQAIAGRTIPNLREEMCEAVNAA